MNRDFWRGKRVLLTGHTGFKGSWLSVWLQSVGAELTGYALAPSASPNLFDAAGVADGMVSIEGDVRDLDHLKAVVSEYRPEILIHLAAQALVRPSYEDPVFTYTTNAIGTMNVLEAARTAEDLRVALMITSDKCYENKEWVWAYRENDRLGGADPYSSSKACAELITDAYRRSFFAPHKYAEHGVAVAEARAGNVIGGGDWAQDRLIPDILRAIGENRSVMIRSPQATRPWQFVLEAVWGYLLLAERLWTDGADFAEAWNFGPDVDDIKPVAWIADYLTRRWGQGASWELDGGDHRPEANMLMLDCTKAKRLLTWHLKLDLQTALDWIIEWYAAFLAGKPLRPLVEEQIHRYENIP